MMEKLWLGTWLRFVLQMRLAPYVPIPPHVCQLLLKQAALQPGDEASARSHHCFA